MSTMDCSQFADQIDEWLRGERSTAARVHARECAACRGMAEDFRAIATTARDWAVEDNAPSERVWLSLRAQLQEEGLIREDSRQAVPARTRLQPQALSPGGTNWLGRLFPLALRPTLAGAYVAALVVASILFVGPSGKQIDDSQWLARTQGSIKPLTAELNAAERTVLSNFASVNPVVSASLHQNLAIVDNDIALCEKSVREEPENELARDYLYQAYEQKADLLAQLADRGVDHP